MGRIGDYIAIHEEEPVAFGKIGQAVTNFTTSQILVELQVANVGKSRNCSIAFLVVGYGEIVENKDFDIDIAFLRLAKVRRLNQ